MSNKQFQERLRRLLEKLSYESVEKEYISPTRDVYDVGYVFESVNSAEQAITELFADVVRSGKPEKMKFEDGLNDATHFYSKALDQYQASLLAIVQPEERL